MIENKIFNGKMNLDSDFYRIQPQDYAYALNITRDAQGGMQDKVVSNIVGNRLVDYTLPTGTNKRLGSFPDLIRNRIYYFVWNSNNKHSILYYDRSTGTVHKLLESLTNSEGIDILGFNPSYRINHIDIIYRDDDGDLLYWTDALNRPQVLNVKEAIDQEYGISWKAQYLNVAKFMPLIPPSATYQDDSSVTINNLHKTLYQFRYRWVYRDFTKSTWSPYSKLLAPTDPDDVATGIDPTKNNRIDVIIQTGAADVIKIEIAARAIGGTFVFTDDNLIKVIDKVEEGVANETSFIYEFFNDNVYPTVSVNESLLLFDYVPRRAYAQGLPNGNVLTYGAITEGITFDFTPDVTSAVTLIDANNVDPLTVVATVPSAIVGQFTFSGQPNTGDIVFITFTFNDNDGADVFEYVGNYVVQVGDTITDILNYFKTFFESYSPEPALFVTIIGNAFQVNSPGTFPLFQNELAYITYADPDTNVDDVSNSIYKHKSKYKFALVYFDDFGVTDGFHAPDNAIIETPELTTTGGNQSDIPNIRFKIFHQPPINAKYFSWVRSLNRTVASFIPTVSCGAEVDGTKFQYLEITNLQNNKDNFGAYEFSEGDRVRIVGIYSEGADGTVNVKEFPIIGLIVDPPNITPTGTYLKIPYDSSAVLTDGGKYYCEIVTPAITTDEGAEVLYEFGETYAILNPGTADRAHGARVQNQIFGSDSSITAPSTAPTATINPIAGNLGIGTYLYAFTFVDGSGNESEASPLSNTITTVAGQQQVNLSVIGVGGAGVVSRNIYRTAANDGTLKLLTTIADNVTTTFADNIADASLGVVMPQPGIYDFIRGDVYSRVREFPTTANLQTIQTVFIVDQSVSDLYPSTIVGNGRAFAAADEATQEKYYPTLQRFGGEFQQNTNINDVNRFYFENQDTYDRANGDIRKIHIEGRNMYVFQKFDVGIVPILTQVVKDTSGNPLEANSDILLNKIQYPYKGKYGIGDVPESFAYYRDAKYFVDPNKGCACRLSQNGVIPLSVLYECNAFFVENTRAFRRDLNNGIVPTGQVYTGDPTIHGIFDYYTNKYILNFEEINRYNSVDDAEPVFHQDPYTLIFLDSRNESEGFETFTTYYPEGMESIGTELVSFKEGSLWVHDNTTDMTTFYGVQGAIEIKPVFNGSSLQKKTYESIGQISNSVWECIGITTSSYVFGTTNQASYLKTGAFKLYESMYHAPLMRATNSRGGLINGDTLKGNWIAIRFYVQNPSDFVTLNMISLKYIDSPLTSR